MSTKVDEHMQNAKEADVMAEKVRDPEARRAYLDIAKHWRRMAEQAERLGW